MLSRLIAFALSQRLLFLVATAFMLGAGVMAFRELPIDAFPDVSSTQVKLILKAPGMTPEEVETRIIAPLEQEMLGIPNQRILRSQAKYAIADITLDFEDGTDIYWARQQVSERLGNVLKDLPASVSGGLAPITTPLGEMYMFTIEGPGTLAEKRSLLDWTIRPQLRGLAGVADVNSLGGLARTFEVVPDPVALAGRKLSVEQLQAALELNNRNDGAGRIAEGEEALLVRAAGGLRSIEDIREIAIARRGDTTIRVKDVAAVQVGNLTRYGAVTKDGRGEAVEGLVLGLRGANARQLVEQVEARLAEIGKTLPKGTTIKAFYNRGNLVERAVSTVARSLGEAVLLVLILLYLFLGNVRAALVVAAILPMSALLTFLMMRYYGLTANLMSLGGLAVAIGMLVDAAVVVVENIESHAAAAAEAGKRASRRHPLHIIYRAVQEVAVPVTAGIAVIVMVFVPLLTLQGLEGKLFTPVALTIVFALSGSLLLSLTIIPVLASYFLGAPVHVQPWLVRKTDALYTRLLDWTLARRRVVYLVAIALLLLAAGIFPFVGKAFMPILDEGDIIMQLEKLPSINLQRSAETDLLVQQAILAHVPEVSSIVARTGSDELGLDPMGPNETDTFLVLKPRAEWRQPDKAKIIDALRAAVSGFPGINVSFTQPIEMRTSEMLSGVRGDLAVKIFGTELVQLNALAAQTAKILEAIPGSEDVQTAKNEGVQYLQVDIDRQQAGRLGLTVDRVEDDLRTTVEGRQVGTIIESGRRTPLVLRGSGAAMSAASFRQINLAIADGESIPLENIATLRSAEGPVKVERENSSRMVVVRANVRGRDLVGFVKEAKAAVAAKLTLPTAYRITWGGQFENQQRASARLAIVVPIALALIFLLLFTTLGSVKQASLVFVNIPFALVGGVVALAISGEYLSVPASVGFIALMGIAVLNGLVMISYFNQLQQKGMDPEQVVREGSRRRLRPVLMTASITAFGLVPMLLAIGPGSEIQRPLAIVVIGGLLTSTLLTLVLLPTLFHQFGMRGVK